MSNMRKEELLKKFAANQLTATEQREVEQLIESGELDLQELESLSMLAYQVQEMNFPDPSRTLDEKFHQMLAAQKESERKPSFSWKQFFSWPEFAPKLALASIALVVGVGIGYILPQRSAESRISENDPQQLEALSKQVSDLKEMMMLSLLEKESATERLKAVSLTVEMDEASTKVTNALIQTLNQDENVNVRLAALEALKPYANKSSVREQLIRAISQQDSPLVQIALAELMAALQEKSSVQELEKIIQSKRTPKEVKNKIKESIKILS